MKKYLLHISFQSGGESYLYFDTLKKVKKYKRDSKNRGWYITAYKIMNI